MVVGQGTSRLARFKVDPVGLAAEARQVDLLREIPELFERDTMSWRCLAVLGFPNYIVYLDGEVYKVNLDNIKEDSKDRPLFELVKPTYAGAKKQPRIKLDKWVTSKDGKIQKVSTNYMVHLLVAFFFCERPEGSKTVKTINGNHKDVHAYNLYWV